MIGWNRRQQCRSRPTEKWTPKLWNYRSGIWQQQLNCGGVWKHGSGSGRHTYQQNLSSLSQNVWGGTFEDTNIKATIPPLPPDPPPSYAATILPKLEQDTTPHIDTEEVVVEYTNNSDDTEGIPPREIIHNYRYKDEEDEEEENINSPSTAEERTCNYLRMKF